MSEWTQKVKIAVHMLWLGNGLGLSFSLFPQLETEQMNNSSSTVVLQAQVPTQQLASSSVGWHGQGDREMRAGIDRNLCGAHF